VSLLCFASLRTFGRELPNALVYSNP
jgi:hypothetical protein